MLIETCIFRHCKFDILHHQLRHCLLKLTVNPRTTLNNLNLP
jgi:hypothetical protein